jgi:lipid A 3-O-deacylase
MRWRRSGFLPLLMVGLWLAPAVRADAADLPPPQYVVPPVAAPPSLPPIDPDQRYGILFPAFLATPEREANGFDLRAGGFAHSIGGREAGSADVNVELLGPRLLNVPVEYSYFIPRPQVGVMINTANRTSYAYAGVVWTLNITRQIFLEPIFGASFNNGKVLAPDNTWNSLGCHAMFHTGLSTGYRVDEHWSVIATWEHISNAGTCIRNVGQNDYGVKIGYRF